MSLGDQNATATSISRDARMAMKGDDEPIKTHSRKLRPDGGHSDSVLCNLTHDARDIVGLQAGEMAQIHVFRDCIVIERGGANGSN
jgi:hypothetical protein